MILIQYYYLSSNIQSCIKISNPRMTHEKDRVAFELVPKCLGKWTNNIDCRDEKGRKSNKQKKLRFVFGVKLICTKYWIFS